MKTKKSVLRRVKITASGKVLHGSNFKRHLRRNKTKAHLRRLKKTKEFSAAINRKVKNALGVA
ncbi:50S ribosomal protein L35 [Patescibacteria group bacterium]|nr:50S ribosomal protein L35 [Patescibacteria group bacterium]